MATNVHAFRATDLQRAIRCAGAAGLIVTSVVINKAGTVELKTAPSREPVVAEDIVAKLK
jgi:hypothetical protein